MDEQKKPLGVTILGWINCAVFGALFFLMSLSSYLKATPQDLEKITEIFKSQGISSQITFQQFKIACIFYIGIAVMFFLSGLGLLLGKDWARKLTLAFAFLAVVVVFLAVLISPALIQQAIMQIIYPGILIIYFTNKKVEEYFRDTNKRINPKS
jgi:Na+-translocating ferredoxin:NAD+ oxidoreductase RnfD subunit